MGDRYGAAGSNLFFKEWHDTAAAAKDVAESYGYEFRVAMLIDFLQYEFCRAFGCAHYAGGIYGFVSGNQHKNFSMVFIC